MPGLHGNTFRIFSTKDSVNHNKIIKDIAVPKKEMFEFWAAGEKLKFQKLIFRFQEYLLKFQQTGYDPKCRFQPKQEWQHVPVPKNHL